MHDFVITRKERKNMEVCMIFLNSSNCVKQVAGKFFIFFPKTYFSFVSSFISFLEKKITSQCWTRRQKQSI